MNQSFWRTPQTAIDANQHHTAGYPHTLAQAQTGQTVTIQGFEGITPAHRQHLQAYGLLPGRSVRVLAQRPVTIILVEQTELAFENDIARQVVIA